MATPEENYAKLEARRQWIMENYTLEERMAAMQKCISELQAIGKEYFPNRGQDEDDY